MKKVSLNPSKTFYFLQRCCKNIRLLREFERSFTKNLSIRKPKALEQRIGGDTDGGDGAGVGYAIDGLIDFIQRRFSLFV